MSEVIVIGLTGPSGSGKSTVSAVFERYGFHVINADLIAREVVAESAGCLAELTDEFSRAILNPDGTLNRRGLGSMVFASPEKLKRLGQIIYPYITYRLIKRIQSLREENVPFALLDAPTLFESRVDDFCKLVVCVGASRELRAGRIMARDGLAHSLAIERIDAQPDFAYYAARSDMIIENNGSIALLEAQAKQTATKILEYYHDKTDEAENTPG